jgi:hypothetical protein
MNGFAMNNPKAQPTAAACYLELFAECQDLIKRIGGALEQHRQKQAQAPAHWGYAGDLNHVTEQLACVLAALGDRSAVEAKGLED